MIELSDNDWPHSTPPFKKDPPANTVGVVIPVKDGLKFLKLNLYSVLYFTSHPFMLTVIDNQSGLKAKKFLRSFTQNHPIEVLRYDEPFNFAAEVNLGLRHVFSKGAKFGLILNADAIVEPDWLTLLVENFHRDPQLAAVGPVSNVGMGEHKHYRQDAVQEVARLSGFCMLIRKEAFEAIGGFDEAFVGGGFEDWDFSQRLRDAGWRLQVDRRVHVHHFWKCMRRAPEYDVWMVENEKRFFKKHPSVLAGVQHA